jgi:ATP-binding cassette subfamily B protein/ATP-binding cassette subfamily C protein LapB
LELANIKDVTPEEIEKYSSPIEDELPPTNNERLLKAFKNVLDFYYGDVSLDTILTFSPNSEEGFTSETVVDISFEMGLNAVHKKMPARDIAHYFLPCIIFNKDGESFIFASKANREITLINPLTNEKETHDASYLKHFNEAILIFRDQKKSEFIDIEKTHDWFWRPVKSFWRSYIEIGVLTFFINIFALAIPLFTMNVYDRVVPNNATETLFVLAVGVVIILIFDIVFKSARNHIIEKVGKRLGMFLEDELMKRMLLVRSGYDTMLVGMKANLFRELAQVKDFFAARSIVQVIDFPFFFIAMIVIYLISPAVAMVPLTIAIIIIVFNIIMQIPVSNLSKDRLQNMQTKHSYLVELIQGSEMIKLSNAVPTKLFNWRNIVAFTDTIAMKIQSINVFSMNLSQTVMQFLTLFVIIVGVYEIAANNLTVGGLIAVTILATRAMVPIVQLSSMIIRFKEIKESLIIINDFWHLPTETDKQIEVGVGKLKGEIEFKDVSFFYKDSKYASVNKLNLKIRAGERVGIIGQTGAGKSTILRMLTGLDVPTKGSVFIDGHDLSTIHPVEFRQNVGVMPQEPFLFDGTLKENIELSAPISKEKMMEVIKMIGLESLVKKSGQGDGMRVGEGGSNLSVGQRHLVALARAIVNNPSVLILDEPTTGLDIGLERTLVNKLQELMVEKTLIVITHRFTALELVDRVIVLSEGKIVADGPKDKVLAALQGKKQ